MKRFHLFLPALLISFSVVYSQPNLKEMIRSQSRIAADLKNPVEGFGRKLSGEDIVYHSTRQDCQNALLVRATDGNMSISWETPPIHPGPDTQEIQLFLIAGMSLQGYEMQGVDPGFRVLINDKPYFHFSNKMGETWTTGGPGDSRMLFETVFKDQANDGFGYARIVLPVNKIEPGKPVKVTITGDSSASRHWFMVFQCTDGLDWFVRKTRIDGWFDIQLVNTGKKWQGKVVAPENRAENPAEISFDGGKPQKLKFTKQEKEAVATFALPLTAELLTYVDADGLNINDIDITKPGSRSLIRPDRLISFQVSLPDPKNPVVHVQVASSNIAADLDNISGSVFSKGKFMIMASSHQDIAWMDSPQACVVDRDSLLITPALRKLEENPLYFNDMEDILMLREYLDRHPEKKQQIYNLTRSGRLTWGASYMQPYEEMYFGEPLIRQFYLGRKWFRKEFPGCDSRIYWNVDVPGRTLQMPQILAKSGVDYMIISRHDQGLFHWQAPDGSKVLTFSPGHYYNSYVNLKKGFFESVRHFSEMTNFWAGYYGPTTVNPVMPLLSDADMAVPDSYFDYIDIWNSLNDSTRKLPELVHTTAEKFMDATVETGVNIPVIRGERPAVWLYIHGPSHFEALKAGRSAGRLLPAAEKMAAFRSSLTGNWSTYPQEKLTKAWESAIYPDHGWGGKNGDITDQVFLEKFREADQTAQSIIRESTNAIASNIGFPIKGMPLVIFNSLSWERTDPLEILLNFPDEALKAFIIKDGMGNPVEFQIAGPAEFYESGYLKSARTTFIAEKIPSMGYQAYYVTPEKKKANSVALKACPELIETEYYQIRFGKGGMESLFDKVLMQEIWQADQFQAGDLFSMHSEGNGAGEFSDIQQPDMEGFEKPGISGDWKLLEAGPVRMVIEGTMVMKHNKAKLTWTIYPTLRRVSIQVDLIDWDGTAYREFRLAFPARLQNPEIAYEVPFGVVRVGKDELDRAAGERYTTLCKDVHPRGINNWISASDNKTGVTISSEVAVWDYVNMTSLPTGATLLQPILLASRQSCHGEGPLYDQKGSHTMTFTIFTHAPGWQNGYHEALQANEKLFAVFNPVSNGYVLPASLSLLSVNDPDAIISTVKKSEDDNSMIIRLFDQSGKDRFVRINLLQPPVSVEKTDMIEENGRNIPFYPKGMTINLEHNAIETYKIRF